MFFKNASIYELSEFNLSNSKIESKLSTARFVELNDNDVLGSGFEHIQFSDSEKVVHEVNDCFFFKYIKAMRSVPVGQLNALVAKGVSAAELSGQKITNKFKSNLTDIARAELLRVQPVKHVHIRAYIDVKRQLLVVDNASDTLCDDLTKSLRKVFGSFRCSSIGVEYSPCDFISDWIALSADEFRIPMPQWLNINFCGTIKARGDDAKQTLVSKSDTVVRDAFTSLFITECDMFKTVYETDYSNAGLISFTLCSKPNTSFIKLSKIDYDVKDEKYDDSDDGYYNAQLYLIAAELGTLIEELSSVFGGRFGSGRKDMITEDVEKALKVGDGKVIWLSEGKT